MNWAHHRAVEPLESRVLLDGMAPSALLDWNGAAANTASVPVWQSMGPAPVSGAQVTVTGGAISGAIQSIAVHPTDANTIYIGSVNGGVWKTTNGGTTWTPLTDFMPSLSIGDVVFDRGDPTNQTIVVGTGRVSNFASRGDDQIGLYRSTNGGASWSRITASAVTNKAIRAMWVTGSTMLVATTTDGVWRSTNTGATWTDLSDGTAGHLPNNISVPDLVVDPSDNNVMYAGVVGSGVWRSADGGVTWSNVTSNISTSSSSSLRLAVHASAGNNVVYAATVSSGVLSGMWYSTNAGSSWTQMDTPTVHYGGQGTLNTALAADPTNPNLVYIAGDRIASSPYTANIFRGDRSKAAGSQFTLLVNSGANNTAPHADSRAIIFTAAGELLECDDGGIYKLASPSVSTSSTKWTSVNGNLQVEEIHDIAWNAISNTLIAGLQDNGTVQQPSANAQVWNWFSSGDGGDVAVDSVSMAGSNRAIRYFSSQNLGGFARQVLNSSNGVVSTTNISTAAILSTDFQFVTPIEINTIDPLRLLIGGVANLYESSNRGDTITSIGAPGANQNAMVYGGSSGGIANADLIYVGKNSQVYKRTSSGGAIAATSTLPSGVGTIVDVAIDPDEWNTVFAVDNDEVFRSLDAGVTWSNLTSNLTTLSSTDFRTIEYVPGAAADTLVVGTRSGVFSLRNPATGGTPIWVKVGSGLPDLLVYDLEYDASDDILAAGTLGRGAWALATASASLNAADATGPTVASIIRADPNPTSSTTVVFTVTFDESVAGVDTGDFSLAKTGTVGGSISSVSGNGTTFTVTISSLTGDGTLGLNLADNDTITDGAGNALGGAGVGNGNFTGQAYSVDHTLPTADILDVTPDPRALAIDSITITFSEAVAGFDLSDLSLTRDAGASLLTGAQSLTTADNITWTLTNLASLTGARGAYTLTLAASGTGIADAAGNAPATGAADAWTVVDPMVVGRRVFYNNSAFDGNESAANAADDGAVATNKSALLPGSTATFANYTSFFHGLNGVMIDLLSLPVGATLSAADFEFRVGNNSDPTTWAIVPVPASVAVRSGSGAGGSDRITLVWADNAIQKQWLQVKVLVTANTGLGTPDLFYFGNAIGEAGNNAANANVDAADELLARANGTGLGTTDVLNPYDYNRDKHVNAQDQLIARSNRSGLAPLKLITIPAAPVASPSTPASAMFSAVSSTTGTADGVFSTTTVSRQLALAGRVLPRPIDLFAGEPVTFRRDDQPLWWQ